MTIAQQILAQVSGAREAQMAAMNEGGNCYYYNGMEIYTFYQDNSTLVIIPGIAVFAGKGR